MTKSRLLASSPSPSLPARLAAGCGSSKPSVGADEVAVVGDCAISKEQFNRLLDQAKKSYKAQQADVPGAGTEQYTALRKQAMQFLVQRCEFNQEADELGSRSPMPTSTSSSRRSRRSTSARAASATRRARRSTRRRSKKQGLTEEQVREDVRASVVQNKIYAKVTDGVHGHRQGRRGVLRRRTRQQYVQPESRDVRHILVKKKALADKLDQQLKSGAELRGAREEVLTGPGLEGVGRQADDLEGPPGAGVRQGRVRARGHTSSRSRSRRSTAGTSSRR